MKTDGHEAAATDSCRSLDLERSRGNPEYWTQVLNSRVVGCRLEEVTRGYSASRVYRVHLEYGERAGGGPASVICKESLEPWPDPNPAGLTRELFVYTRCLSRLPRIGATVIQSVELEGLGSRIVLEDLSLTHSFKERGYKWRSQEMGPTLETFALLHVSAEEMQGLDNEHLMPAAHERWPPDVVMAAVSTLNHHKFTSDQVGRLTEVVEPLLQVMLDERDHWRARPKTLLHCDLNNGNVAVPNHDEGVARGRSEPSAGTELLARARLIDWHIAGVGMSSLDIASVFYQPYHNHLYLDWRGVLDHYNSARYRLDGVVRDSDEEWSAFCYAMAANGLSYLPPVAAQLERTEKLDGWWPNMLTNIIENLGRCAALGE